MQGHSDAATQTTCTHRETAPSFQSSSLRALPQGCLALSFCICWALSAWEGSHLPSPTYQFTIRLKINLRLLLMSIAQRQKNNSYTCSLFVSPAPYGELLMDRGFHRDCLLTG